jgi:hypothetical protein
MDVYLFNLSQTLSVQIQDATVVYDPTRSRRLHLKMPSLKSTAGKSRDRWERRSSLDSLCDLPPSKPRTRRNSIQLTGNISSAASIDRFLGTPAPKLLLPAIPIEDSESSYSLESLVEVLASTSKNVLHKTASSNFNQFESFSVSPSRNRWKGVSYKSVIASINGDQLPRIPNRVANLMSPNQNSIILLSLSTDNREDLSFLSGSTFGKRIL